MITLFGTPFDRDILIFDINKTLASFKNSLQNFKGMIALSLNTKTNTHEQIL